jgi:hypothetical protein
LVRDGSHNRLIAEQICDRQLVSNKSKNCSILVQTLQKTAAIRRKSLACGHALGLINFTGDGREQKTLPAILHWEQAKIKTLRNYIFEAF